MFSARLALVDEVGLVQRVTEAAYAEYAAVLDAPPQPVTEEYGPRIAVGEVWLVARAGEVAGLMVLEMAKDHAMIFSLAVLPAAQGAGLGRWMLGFAEDRAREAGRGEVRLYTNALMTRNIRIYGEAGFREAGRRDHPTRPGWMVVDMVKPVGAKPAS